MASLDTELIIANIKQSSIEVTEAFKALLGDGDLVKESTISKTSSKRSKRSKRPLTVSSNGKNP